MKLVWKTPSANPSSQILKCMDTKDSGVHAYDRQTPGRLSRPSFCPMSAPWIINWTTSDSSKLHGVSTETVAFLFLRRRGSATQFRTPPFRPLVRCTKPVLKQVKTWPAGAISALQDCFECTDWNMFREAANNGNSINLEEYTTSVTSYIGKCINAVTVSKTMTTCSNQKP
ncbi:hypothetical protein QTP86_005680 [Hemibagrus guttatus]|nr:hypothetical protein QTP86_005680 [Hemibagrus guttatus]